MAGFGDDPPRRRRRVRGQGEASSAPPAAGVAGRPAVAALQWATGGAGLDEAGRWLADPGDSDTASAAERGLRGLVGGGSSQVSPAAAMRARDAARPRPEDLSRAETELVIIRRHWTPRDQAPRDQAPRD